MCDLGNIYYTPSNSSTSSSFYMKHTINRDLTVSQTSLVLYALFTLGSMLFGYYHSNHILPTQLLDLSHFMFRLQYNAMEAHMSHSQLTLAASASNHASEVINATLTTTAGSLISEVASHTCVTETTLTNSQPSRDIINEEDNQHGAEDATLVDLTQTKQFHKFNCATCIGKHLLCGDLNYSWHKPATQCSFMYLHYQHAHGTIYLQVPHNTRKEHNPEQQKIHMVTINFPAHKIDEQVQCSLMMTELFKSLPQGFKLPQLGDIEYHLIKFTAQDCIVSRGNLPKLLNEDLQEQVQAAISFTQSRQRQDPIDVTILVEGDSTMAFAETSSFNVAIRAEKKEDLLMAFYELTPCAKVLQLGNIIDFEARPNIPVQPAHLVFGDSMEYQVPHIMGATYEQEFWDFATNDYGKVQFEST